MNSGYRRRNRRHNWLLIFFIVIVGIFLGGALASYLSGQFEMLSWMGRALEIGTQYPWSFTSPLLEFSIFLTMTFNIGSLVGLILALLVYQIVRRF